MMSSTELRSPGPLLGHSLSSSSNFRSLLVSGSERFFYYNLWFSVIRFCTFCHKVVKNPLMNVSYVSNLFFLCWVLFVLMKYDAYCSSCHFYSYIYERLPCLDCYCLLGAIRIGDSPFVLYLVVKWYE